MPLKRGTSRKTVSANIETEIAAGANIPKAPKRRRRSLPYDAGD